MTTQVNGKSLDLPFTFGYAALRCTGRIFLDMNYGWLELDPAEFSEDITCAARKGFNLLTDSWGISFVQDVQAQCDAFSAHRGYRLSLLRASLAQQRRSGGTDVSGTDCEQAIARISELLRSHRTWI